jgi:hypothetical protein
MRFIFNFIFFGLLFYAIYYFFPDAFANLVTWTGEAFNYIKSLIQQLFSKLPPVKKESTGSTGNAFFDLFF